MFKTRSRQLELLDTGEYTAEEYEGCLAELRKINRWLGDQTALEKSLLTEIKTRNPDQFSVLDVGAGSGEFLRIIADSAADESRRSTLIGVELNARSARSIIEESKDYPAISAVRADAFRLPFADSSFDFVICSLFTHHFVDEKVVEILREMKRVARIKIFVIDLERHPVAYYFYTTVGKLFLYNRLIRHDGALSILRSFKPAELAALAQAAELKNFQVRRVFPYRLVLEGS